MNNQINKWVFTGAVFGFLGVLLGAFGAHVLAKVLTEKEMGTYQTATLYQFIHAIALILAGLWSKKGLPVNVNITGWCFTAGIVLFSYSLYAIAFGASHTLGLLTPVGGLLLMLGWLSFAAQSFRSTQ